MYFPKAPTSRPTPTPPMPWPVRPAGVPPSQARSPPISRLGPSGKARADGVRETFLRGPTAIQELIAPMITGEPYPIKGLIAFGVNMFHSLPDQERTRQALEALDLVVAIDVLPQDHIAWADVVLPESIYLERADDLWAVAHKTPVHRHSRCRDRTASTTRSRDGGSPGSWACGSDWTPTSGGRPSTSGTTRGCARSARASKRSGRPTVW